MIGKILERIIDGGLVLMLGGGALLSFSDPWAAFRVSVLALLGMIVVELKRITDHFGDTNKNEVRDA